MRSLIKNFIDNNVERSASNRALFFLLSLICIAIIQDYFHSQRNDIPFFLHESLIFKGYWLAALPIMYVSKVYVEKLAQTSVYKIVMLLSLLSTAHCLLGSVCIWLLSLIIKDQPYGLMKIFSYVSANDLLKIVIFNACLLLFLQFKSLRNTESASGQSLDHKSALGCKYLSVNNGRKKHLIEYGDIFCIQSASPYVEIQLSLTQHLYSSSLKALLPVLDNRFLRIHRGTIVNIDKIDSYHSRMNGDYDVCLSNGARLRLSRHYVKQFKNRITANTTQVEF